VIESLLRRIATTCALAACAAVAGCVQPPPRPPQVAVPQVVVPQARSPLDGHPRLLAAVRQLDATIEQLRAARNGDDGFGGHRQRALGQALQARAEIYRAAQFANSHR
jgi:hypothetical protein